MKAPLAAAERRDTTRIITKAKPVIIMISGLPGTGKSFLSKRLAECLHYVILESDEIRKTLIPRPTYSPQESTRVFRFIGEQTDELLKKGISVIYDATNLKEKHRESVHRLAEKNGAKFIIVRVDAPADIVEKRLKNRAEHPDTHDKSDADWAVYQRMKATAEKISRSHFTIDTSRDITAAIERIVREANR